MSGGEESTMEGKTTTARRCRATDSARVIQVIVTETIVGKGDHTDPVRVVKEYWDFDGNRLAVNDAWEDASAAGKTLQAGCPADQVVNGEKLC